MISDQNWQIISEHRQQMVTEQPVRLRLVQELLRRRQEQY